MKMIFRFLIVLCFAWHMVPVAFAQETITLTYQGQLRDAGGEAISGTRAVTFRLYDQMQGGAVVWSDPP